MTHPAADGVTFARTKLLARLIHNEALTSRQQIKQATDIARKYNSGQSAPIKYDQCDMFITAKAEAVDLISLLLRDTPLSQKSVSEPEQDAQGSSAAGAAPISLPQGAALNSPPDGAAPNSPSGGAASSSPHNETAQSAASQDQAGPSCGAVSNNPSNEALPLDQGTQTADPSPSTSRTAATSSPPPSPALTPADVPLPAEAASSALPASTMVAQEPLDKHAQLGHLEEDPLQLRGSRSTQ